MKAKLKYLITFILPLSAWLGFYYQGYFAWLTLLISFVFIPLIEFFIPVDTDSSIQEIHSNFSFFRFLLWLIVPIQWGTLLWFLSLCVNADMGSAAFWGNVSAMGILCGVYGINVAHELGHSTRKVDQFLAKWLLLSSLYMHFFIEHNFGHHKWVGTEQDGATARKNESVYSFWIRSVVRGIISAWHLEAQRIKRKKLSVFRNQTLQLILIEVIWLGVLACYSWQVLLAFVIVSLIGIVLLETVNYIEHYGLMRNRINEFRYEEVEPRHSWNSDHVLGRIVLFELSRHSDHHANPERAYPLLRSLPEAKHMPAGYPAMMLLALVPAWWFRVMNARLEN